MQTKHVLINDDVIIWKHFPCYWSFVRGIHRSPVNSPHKGQWRGALMFSLICTWINGWVNNREAGDLTRHRALYDVIVMWRTDLLHSKRCWQSFVASRLITRGPFIYVESVQPQATNNKSFQLFYRKVGQRRRKIFFFFVSKFPRCAMIRFGWYVYLYLISLSVRRKKSFKMSGFS